MGSRGRDEGEKGEDKVGGLNPDGYYDQNNKRYEHEWLQKGTPRTSVTMTSSTQAHHCSVSYGYFLQWHCRTTGRYAQEM